MGLFHRNEAEKEAKKLAKQQEKTSQKARDERELRKIDIKREALEAEDKRLNDMAFHRRLNTAKAKLSLLEDDFMVKLCVERNNLKNIINTKRSDAVRKSKQRIKNYYYSLAVIERAKERLNDVESDYEWSSAMAELSGTFKLMNKLNSGFEPIKKLLFRVRMKNSEMIDNVEFTKLKGYYGKDINEEVSDQKVNEVMAVDPMDMLVSDDIFQILMEDDFEEKINSNIKNGGAIYEEPSDLVDKVKEEDRIAVSNGAESVADVLEPSANINTDEQIQSEFSML